MIYLSVIILLFFCPMENRPASLSYEIRVLSKQYRKRFLKARVLSRRWVVGQLGACRRFVHGSTLSCRVVGTSFFNPARPPSVVLGDGLRSQEIVGQKYFRLLCAVCPVGGPASLRSLASSLRPSARG